MEYYLARFLALDVASIRPNPKEIILDQIHLNHW